MIIFLNCLSKSNNNDCSAYKEIPIILLTKLLTITEPGMESKIFSILIKQIYPIQQQSAIPLIVSNIILSLIAKNPDQDQAANYKKLVVRYVQGFVKMIDKASFREINKFISFLSFYIHNTDYEWNWDIIKNLPSTSTSQWTEITEEEKAIPEDPRKPKHNYFLKYLVNDLQQLCYAAKLQEVLPTELQVYIYSENIPFKYSNPEEIGYSDAQIILDRIKEKVTGEQLSALIKSSASQIEAEGEMLFDIIARCIFSLTQYFLAIK